jgi:Na+-transporting methylmalonyl-CoA/oxaloacetate decarboxylase gamma subunit
MKKNMGIADKGIRLLLSGILAIVYFMGAVEGTFGIVLLVLAIVFAATSFISFCPLYTILGISTAAKKEKHAPPQQQHKHHHKK